MDESLVEKIIAEVRVSRKYRELDLPGNLLRQILTEQTAKGGSSAEITAAFRRKLHNIVAPYLEDIDYPTESEAMRSFFETNPTISEQKAWAAGVMSKHASTRERLPHLDEFCGKLRKIIGSPGTVLDLACALDPLMLLWLDLPAEVNFFAYDIHKPRLEFLSQFFALKYPSARAIHQDILGEPPEIEADCAFFFKEAHRFEKRQSGCNDAFFSAVRAPLLLVSLPAADLSGHHSLVDYHTQLIDKACAGRGWGIEQDQVGNELLFIIRKGSSR